jgi:mercuric ion transport protein
VWLRLGIAVMETSTTSTRAPASAPCTCDPNIMRSSRIAKWTTVGGFLAALGICSACCLLPFALVTFGVATAWAGALERLSTYKWPLIGVTAALLAYGFFVAYGKPMTSCSAGPACQACGSSKSLKVGLWIVTSLAIAGVVFEQIEPHLK